MTGANRFDTGHWTRSNPVYNMSTKKRADASAPASPEQLRARLELRRSSAASKHVPTPRKGTRRKQRARAIAAGW